MKPWHLALVGALACVACGSAADDVSDDDVAQAGSGGSGGAAGVVGGGGAAPAMAFEQVFQPMLVDRGCVFGCHDASALGGLMLKPTETGPPDIESAYAALVDHVSVSPECAGWPRVVPGAPHESLLWIKLAAELGVADVTTCGDPMPKGATQIDAEDLALVEAWIEAGAPR